MVEHGRSTAKPRYAAGKKVDGKLLKAERTSSSESSCFHPWVFLSKRERGFSADVMRTLESFVPPPPDGKTEAAMQRALDLLKTEATNLRWSVMANNRDKIQYKDGRLLLHTVFLWDVSEAINDYEIVLARPTKQPQRGRSRTRQAGHVIDPFWGLFLVLRMDTPFHFSSRRLFESSPIEGLFDTLNILAGDT